MKEYLNISNLCIFTWCLYYLQRPLGIEGSIISQSILLFNLSISIYYVIHYHKFYETSNYFKALDVLLSMFIIYGLISIIDGEHIKMYDYYGRPFRSLPNYYYLKNICISLLPIYQFYVFSKKGWLSDKVLKTWVFFFIFHALIIYSHEQKVLIINALEHGSLQEDFTNNSSYLFLSLIPIIALFDKRGITFYLLLSFCLFFIISGMKRGAIIATIFVLLLFILKTFLNASRDKKIKYFIYIIPCIIIIFLYVRHLFLTNEFFQERLSETIAGNSSHREYLFEKLTNYYYQNANFVQLLFGYGADGTIKIIGQYAHNDWIEILINNGIIGIFIYLYYWIAFTRQTWARSNDKSYYTSLQILFISYLMKSLFSMSYFYMEIFASIMIGFCLAQINNNKEFSKRRMKI